MPAVIYSTGGAECEIEAYAYEHVLFMDSRNCKYRV